MTATGLPSVTPPRLARFDGRNGAAVVDDIKHADDRARSTLLAALRATATLERSGEAYAAMVRGIDRYASSTAVKRCAIRRANRRSDHPLPLYLADEIDVTALTRGQRRGQWHLKKKLRGGQRRVCTLSTALASAQTIAKDIIFALHQPGNHISDWRGRGLNFHHQNLLRDLEAGGRFVVLADVVDCFQSVCSDHIYDNGILSPEFVGSCLDHRRIRLRAREGTERINAPCDPPRTLHGRLTAPVGLLGGGPASNALWAVMIDDLPASLPGSVWDRTYADNIAVVCRTEPECADVEESLNRYFADHPAGPFSLSIKRENIDAGFDHLGYQYLKCGDEIHLTPSDYNLGKMLDRIELARQSACTNGDLTELARAVERELARARLAPPAFRDVLRLEAMAFGGSERRDDDGGDLPPIFGADSASHICPPSVPRWSCEPRR